MKKAKNEKRLKNILLYQYMVSETGDYMAERFEVLDSYYYDTGYEGYYEKNEEYHVSVYHMILDEEKNVIFPYEEYEEKESWSTIEAIARQVRAKGNSKEKKEKYAPVRLCIIIRIDFMKAGSMIFSSEKIKRILRNMRSSPTLMCQ